MPFIILFILIFLAGMARSEDHIHGVNVPNWYDPACCDNKDCRPVDAGDDPLPGQDATGEPFYTWRGLVFDKAKFRRSQDSRYHVCVYNGMARCIYLPALT